MGKKTCPLIFLGLGVFGLIFGGIFIGVYPSIYGAILKWQMVVEVGSTSYEMWETLPIPMYMKLYFFNITNSEDIVARIPGVKPIVKEVGPYVFKEEHRKEQIQFDDPNSKVSFYQVKTWHFLRDQSVGSLDDEITTVNAIAMAAAEFVRNDPSVFMTYQVDQFFQITRTSLFMTHKIRNLTFDGILDDLMAASDDLPFPLPIPFDRFGWFYPRNESLDYDGYFSMYTGADDINKVGQISNWNNKTEVPAEIYPSYCGHLNGSAGEFFPPNRDKTFVDFFTPDLCRSIRFNYKEETDFEDIAVYKYFLDESLMANVSSVSSNGCFNPYADESQPIYNGLLNVSSCKFNAPAYVSYPHFYNADPFYIDQFQEGSLHPNAKDHESHLMLEPFSGVPIDVKVRMQINMLVRPVNKTQDGVNFWSIQIIDGQKPTFYPMIWFETYTELNDEIRALMKLLAIAPYLGIYLGPAFIGLGALVTVISFAIFMRRRQRRHFA